MKVYRSLSEFYGAVAPRLELREAENSLLLGLTIALQESPPETEMFMGTAGGLAAFFTGHLLLLSAGDDAEVQALAQHLADKPRFCPGVVGPVETVERFTAPWLAMSGGRVSAVVRQRIYELKEVQVPAGISGRMRVASMDDFDTLLRWSEEFHNEAIVGHAFEAEKEARTLRTRIEQGKRFIWEAGGRPVSMAGMGRPTGRTISIGPVFTPKCERRNGYASALTASLSQYGLEMGKEATVLFTDLSNPTSNSIYMKIGYKPVADSRNHWFSYTQ